MESKTYVCGCVNNRLPCGTYRSVSKCEGHRVLQREVGELGEDYYREVGVFNAQGKLDSQKYVDQLHETVGVFPKRVTYQGRALEVGCGLSPYVEAIQDAGYLYEAVEPSRFATEYMRKNYGAIVHNKKLDEVYRNLGTYDLLMSAHSLEHMDEAIVALHTFYGLLRPNGLLFLVIPDDTDQLNPDHLWFFSVSSILYHLQEAGFEVETHSVRKHIERENFIYLRARKPS